MWFLFRYVYSKLHELFSRRFRTCLPGNGTILAVAPERQEFVKKSAKQLMELIKKDIKPRDIVTIDAIDNAFASRYGNGWINKYSSSHISIST